MKILYPKQEVLQERNLREAKLGISGKLENKVGELKLDLSLLVQCMV